MINEVTLLGRIGQEPETRYSKDGLAIASFSLATTYDKKTEWHKITVFGKLAEIVNEYARKGMLAFVQGRIETNQWTDKEGIKRYSTSVIANSVKVFETVRQ